MYNDINLPDDEAWVAMSSDLRKTKETRNALTKENSYADHNLSVVFRKLTINSSQLKRRIAESEMQREEFVSYYSRRSFH